MKLKKMNKKLSFKKETISNLELDETFAGGTDYSQCGTGQATIAPCMCPTEECYTVKCVVKTEFPCIQGEG